MKFLITLLLLTFVNATSQNISLDELISLRSKNLPDVEEYLSAKNWSFLKSTEESKLTNVIFTYKKHEYSEYAQSFITYMYSNNDIITPNRIYAQIMSKDLYNKYISKLKTYNCKLIKSSVQNGEMKKIYQGKTLTFIVNVMMSTDEDRPKTNLYTFYIMTNVDFQESFD